MKEMMTAPEPLRVLVVDDERPARSRLIDLLRRDSQVTSVAEGQNGAAAVALVRRDRPDLLFLDVQMPELDGIGVVEALGQEMPLTVFVTAYDHHAVRAFEANALDYLLKPFSDRRFEAAMARAKSRLAGRNLSAMGAHLLQLTAAAAAIGGLDRLVVRSGGTTRFVKMAEVDWIEAAGVYVNLHAGPKEWLYRASLSDLADRLDARRFVRVHRSAMVNIDSIVHLDGLSHGEFDAVLKSGARVRISRTYRARLEERLGQPLL
jgi:two-component system, LytTR family, response regulator